MSFTDITIDASEFERASEWYDMMEQDWKSGIIKGKDKLEEIIERLDSAAQNSAVQEIPAAPVETPPAAAK